MSGTAITPIRICELSYPEDHPEGAGPGELFVFLLRNRANLFLVDTGIGTGYAPIDQRYSPKRTDLLRALDHHGVAPTDLRAIVCTHLHFDHCGNNRLFPGIPIYVQRAEYEAAQAPRYTVPDWAFFEGAEYRLLDGPLELAHGVRLIPTPGHTIGHQSVVVSTAAGLEAIVGQAAYTAAEFDSYRTPSPQRRDDVWSISAYAESLQALHALNPSRAYFSHDSTIWQPET